MIGCIKTTKTAAEFESTGLALILYRRHFGTIPLGVEHQASPLDIAAALTGDRRTLTVAVVNPTRDSVALEFAFNTAEPAQPASTWIITAGDPMASNQPGKPRRVDIQEAPMADLGAAVSVQPLSITMWRIPIR